MAPYRCFFVEMSRHLVVFACVAMVVSAAAARAQHGAAQLEATAFVTSEDKCEIVAGIHSNGSCLSLLGSGAAYARFNCVIMNIVLALLRAWCFRLRVRHFLKHHRF